MLPKAFKSWPKSNKLPDLVTLVTGPIYLSLYLPVLLRLIHLCALFNFILYIFVFCIASMSLCLFLTLLAACHLHLLHLSVCLLFPFPLCNLYLIYVLVYHYSLHLFYLLVYLSVTLMPSSLSPTFLCLTLSF